MAEAKKDKKKELPWSTYSEAEKQALETLSKGYIEFLTKCKTERESVREIIRQAEAAGYEDLEKIVREGRALAPGAKVYQAYMKKAVALFHVGTEPLENGLAILGAHIDTCRLDVKQNPLYEDGGLGYLDTHYYGGIKKYQWVTLPLALHGVVVKKDGTALDIVIGEEASDPTFCVTDLLVHLSQEQLKKSADKVVEGEKLDVLVGTLPLFGEEKEAVQKNILHLLREKYGIEEEDFLSAELSFVPAGAAREMGFDRSMILGYGQDDRVCSYTSLAAMLESKAPKRTACCLLVDKEEIGSVGHAFALLREHARRAHERAWAILGAFRAPRTRILEDALVRRFFGLRCALRRSIRQAQCRPSRARHGVQQVHGLARQVRLERRERRIPRRTSRHAR